MTKIRSGRPPRYNLPLPAVRPSAPYEVTAAATLRISPQPKEARQSKYIGSFASQDKKIGGHVSVQGDGSEIFEVFRVVDVDGVPGFVDVQQLSVTADLHRHSRPSREFHATIDLAI